MPKISLDNLERYDGHLKDWCDARFAEKKVHENWHETGPSGAVSFYPVPNRPIDPVVNFAFTETLPSGTKGPDNPSTITGVSSVKITRCGKNLIKAPYYDSSGKVDNGVTWTINSDGSITANGTVGSTGYSRFFLQNNIGIRTNGILLPPGTYFLSGCPSGGSNQTYGLQLITHSDDNSKLSIAHFDYGNGASFIVYEPVHISFYLVAVHGIDVTGLNFKPQLEISSTATPFEPYSGTDYTVNLGNTYYGGSVDLSTGIMTVTWEAKSLTGTESFVKNSTYSDSTKSVFSGVFDIPQSKMSLNQSNQNRICSHFNYLGSDFAVGCFYTWATATNVLFTMDATQYPTKESFASWLATQNSNGTPVVLGYLLNTPYTVQLTPTQIYSLSQSNPYSPNTVYSDQQSILVRYPKSPIVSGSELDDAILSLGGD